MQAKDIVVRAEDFDVNKLGVLPMGGKKNKASYTITYAGKKLILKGNENLRLIERKLARSCVSKGESYFTYHEMDETLRNVVNAISDKIAVLFEGGCIGRAQHDSLKAESPGVKNSETFTYPPIWKVKSCIAVGKKCHIKYVNVRAKNPVAVAPLRLPLAVVPEVKEEQLCVICLEREKQYALVPCGHLCLCLACTECIAGSAHCPVCMGDVVHILRIYQ